MAKIYKFKGDIEMNNPEVQNLINKTICNPQGMPSFINNENELIVSPKLNAYFRLEDIKTELDFKCKCLEWLSHFVADNHWFGNSKERKKIESFINYILGTNIKHSEFQLIYMRLGNRINHALTVKFVESNYDIKVLENKDYKGIVYFAAPEDLEEVKNESTN